MERPAGIRNWRVSNGYRWGAGRLKMSETEQLTQQPHCIGAEDERCQPAEALNEGSDGDANIAGLQYIMHTSGWALTEYDHHHSSEHQYKSTTRVGGQGDHQAFLPLTV